MNNLSEFLTTSFNISPNQISALNGYANSNFLIETQSTKYILKEYQVECGLIEFLQDECSVLELLGNAFPGFFQTPMRSINNEFIVYWDEKPGFVYRLLHYIDGDLFRNAQHTSNLFESVGKLLAEMDTVLLDKNFYAISSRHYDWDILQIDLSRKYAEYIKNPADEKLVDYFYLQFNEQVRPVIPDLRHGIIHGDANDFNIIVKNNAISGLIDFGDSVYSLLVNELAIALTYAMFGKEFPLDWAEPMIRAYCSVLPLTEKEIDLLYYLVGARLCISISKSAHSRIIAPNDNYLTVSEEQALELIRKWIKISPIKASACFRSAAGLKPNINTEIKHDVEKRWKHLSKAFSLSYSENPIKMESAAFQYMFDNLGNTYLDTRNNIPHVGHCHPSVVSAGQRQMAKLNTNTRYIYDVMNDYSEKLLSKFPPSLNKVFYVNSGSAASDLAIRLAYTHTKREKLVVMEYGYHGNTAMGIDISHYKFSGKGGKGQKNNILVAPAPDAFRGMHKGKIADVIYARELIQSLEYHKNTLAAFIAEPLISAAGQIPLTKEYYNLIYPFIKAQGGLCISDEVQTGFGRIGTHFWGFEISHYIPDIVIIGKPMGNGHPMAAVVCTSEIADSFNNGMEFFSSFGGNPVSCATGLAVLDVMEKENLMQNANEVGEYMIQKFNVLKEKFEQFGEVRGSGFCLGVEFVKNKQSLEPATELTSEIVNRLKEKFILVDTDGPFHNVLKIKPPMCFTHENADFLIQEIEEVIQNKSYI